MATIGLRDLYIARCTEIGTGEEYGTPRRLAKAIKVDMSVEIAKAILYADDGADKIEKEFVKGTLKINANDISTEDAAELLGQKVDTDGVAYGGDEDDPPYFAVGFRAKKPGGKYKYMWLYKAKFQIPNETYDTKNEGITFNTPEIEGEFIKRDSDGNWKADYVGTPTDAVASKWFEKVREMGTITDPGTGTGGGNGGNGGDPTDP